jgi:hypothetical protein
MVTVSHGVQLQNAVWAGHTLRSLHVVPSRTPCRKPVPSDARSRGWGVSVTGTRQRSICTAAIFNHNERLSIERKRVFYESVVFVLLCECESSDLISDPFSFRGKRAWVSRGNESRLPIAWGASVTHGEFLSNRTRGVCPAPLVPTKRLYSFRPQL